MSEEQVRERLRELRAPEEQEAEERAWRIVWAAFEQRERVPRPRRGARLAIALAAAAVLVAAAFSPPGEAIGDWLRDAIKPGRKPAKQALVSLPAPGRLLVVSSEGPWVVEPDGTKRLLGAYENASWSPHGLFVSATRASQLVALEPRGRVRWSLARAGAVSEPRWSPDGFRIAYRSGRSLRVVAGDGTADRLLARSVGSSVLGWRRGSKHVLAFADAVGRVNVIDADSRRVLWRGLPSPIPSELSWSPDGRRLLSVSDRSLRLFDARGTLLRNLSLSRGVRAGEAAFNPSGRAVAVIRRDLRSGRSKVVLIQARGNRLAQRLLFTGLAWSPDGRWLLLAWRDADQWLFIRSADVRKVIAVSNISRQFNPGAREQPRFPQVSGWCCRP
jgi:WD40 repeat protein